MILGGAAYESMIAGQTLFQIYMEIGANARRGYLGPCSISVWGEAQRKTPLVANIPFSGHVVFPFGGVSISPAPE